MRNTHQRGIAIGPILFIVAILAVLAAAIAAGSGAFNGDISAVSAKVQAATILEQAENMKIAVDRVLGHGCADTQVNFDNPIVSGYTNATAPSDHSCDVFHPDGGGLSWITPPANASGFADGYIYSGHLGLVGTSSPTGGVNPTQDLVAFLPDVSKKLCEEINRLVFSSTSIQSLGSSQTFGFVDGVRFRGTYWYGYTIMNYLPFSACVKLDHTQYNPLGNPRVELNQYHFYKVLISH